MIKDIEVIKQDFLRNIEQKQLRDDLKIWNMCLGLIENDQYVPLQYKPGHIRYQTEYFKDVYDLYEDISMVLYRGGKPVGIWPMCIWFKEEKIVFGTAGGALVGPIFFDLSKAEAQRKVIDSVLTSLEKIMKKWGGGEIICCETIINSGASQWVKKLMEFGAKDVEVKWQAFVDLSLSSEEIQARIRRTKKNSISKGEDTYDVEIYDENCDNLYDIFEEFHSLHKMIAGRETRSQKTWDIQCDIVREGNKEIGRSFLIFIRDKVTKELAGAALFDCTPQSSYYCVAAYDRSRFAKPVGHIVQAVAIDKMKAMGIRWYELGERSYPGNKDVNDKLVSIGHYKEGFATHLFPRVYMSLKIFQDMQ